MSEDAGPAARTFGLGESEGDARWWDGGLATIKATGKETGDLYSILEVLEPQGARTPLHLHRKEDEAFYVLGGEITFHVGEETLKARPGSFVFGPKNVPHAYTVDSGPAKLLFLLSPAGFEGFVEAISKPAKAHTLPPSNSEGPSDVDDTTDEAESETFAVLEARYGCEIVGTAQGHPPSRKQEKEESMNEDHARRTYGLREGEGKARWWLGGLSTIKAAGKETGGRYTLVEVFEPQGVEVPVHVHHREDEAFYVLEGQMTFYVGEETLKAAPGTFVFGPREVPHAYTIDSGPARFLMLCSPAGFEDFIEETSEPAKALTLPPQSEAPPEEAEMEQLAALAARYGSEIVGPPPGQ